MVTRQEEFVVKLGLLPEQVRLVCLDHMWRVAKGETIKLYSGESVSERQLSALVVNDLEDCVRIELVARCRPYFVNIRS